MTLTRDPYLALMVAAAKGVGVHLSADECSALAADKHIQEIAKSRLDRRERGMPWSKVNPAKDRLHLAAEWRRIPGFETYEISSLGQVRRGGRILKSTPGKYGHGKVSLYNRPNKRRAGIHVLVAESFHGPAPEGKPFACHRNGNAWDNRVENIYWGSFEENVEDMRCHRRIRRSGAEPVQNDRPGIDYAV